MQRRAFCASAIAALGATALPFNRAFAAVSSVAADVDAITGDGKQVTLSRLDVDDFRASLRGQLLLPDSVGYDDARKVWNAHSTIAGPRSLRAVRALRMSSQSVKFARAHSCW